jgi:hypothetical protein
MTQKVQSELIQDGAIKSVNMANGGAEFGMRNRIINGAMMIDQRNAGASVSLVVGQFPYTIDRWQAFSTGANTTLQQVSSGITGIPNVLQITGAASNTSVNVFQKIEAKNCADLAGSTVTLSALISNSLLTTVTWRASYANSVDNFGAVTDIATGSFTVNSSLSQYSVQIALPANAANGVQIFLSCANQTSGTFRLTNVQLEKGTQATPFEWRPYGTELSLCQRYYLQYGKNASNTSAPVSPIGTAASAVDVKSIYTFPVVMRATPTVTQSNLQLVDSVSTFTVTAVSQGANEQSSIACNINFTVASGLTTYRPYWARCAGSANGFVGFSAEL